MRTFANPLRSLYSFELSNTLPVCMTRVIQEQNGDGTILNKRLGTRPCWARRRSHEPAVVLERPIFTELVAAEHVSKTKWQKQHRTLLERMLVRDLSLGSEGTVLAA